MSETQSIHLTELVRCIRRRLQLIDLLALGYVLHPDYTTSLCYDNVHDACYVHRGVSRIHEREPSTPTFPSLSLLLPLLPISLPFLPSHLPPLPITLPPLPLPLPPIPSSFLPSLYSHPSPPLRSRLPLIQLVVWGSAVSSCSRSWLSSVVKRYLVHFGLKKCFC